MLSSQEVKMFYRLHPLLLLETNRIHRLVSATKTKDDLMKLDVKDKFRIREKLYPDFEKILSSLLDLKTHGLNPEEIETIKQWRHFLQDRFIIYKFIKKYSIFLDTGDEPKAYAVHAISNPISDIAPDLPRMADAILLPFNGKIIYDGFLQPLNISFGAGMRSSFKESYENALEKFGIVESLPFNSVMQLQKANEYLFAQEAKQTCEIMRHHAARLSDCGITNGYFAFLETTIVASGASKKQVLSIVNQLVPTQTRDLVWVFRIRDGKPSLENKKGGKRKCRK